MVFILFAIEKILILINILDTLAFLRETRNVKIIGKEEYSEICLTWIFFFLIHGIAFATSFGPLNLIGLTGQIYISIPLLGGRKKIYDLLIQDNKIEKYIKKGANFVKSKIGLIVPTPITQSSPPSQ